jgi:hypothetical protein
VRNAGRFLEWIRAKSVSNLVDQMKGEILMLVSETANDFRATIGSLLSLDESEGVRFQTFSLPRIDSCCRKI